MNAQSLLAAPAPALLMLPGPLSGQATGSSVADTGKVPEPLSWTTQQDHRNMMERLGITVFALARLLAAAPLTDDRELLIRSPADVTRTRAQLIRFVWGADRLPGTLPANVSHGVASPVKDPANVERVDALEIGMEAGQRTVAYHFIPSTNNGHVVVRAREAAAAGQVRD